MLAAAAILTWGTDPALADGEHDHDPPYTAPEPYSHRDPFPGRDRGVRTFTPGDQARRLTPAGRSLSTPVFQARRQPIGALTGKVVFCSAGHGWTADPTDAYPADDDRTWYTQRGNYNELIEDYGNIEQLNYFVIYAWNAGATVVPFRPVGYQVNEVVLDNTHSAVTYGGAWTTSTAALYFGPPAAPAPYYVAASDATTETAVARFTPAIPASGYYPVYGWARLEDDRVNQLYRIRHRGGFTEVRVDHTRVGNGWVWLGHYYFEAGTNGYVEISNYAPGPVGLVVADAIRFGNGMGDIDRGYGVSGYPRELEASRYWIERALGQGAPSSIYDLVGFIDQDDNVGSPPRMSDHMTSGPVGPLFYERIFLSFHTNAGSANTLGLYNNVYPLTGQIAFAQAINDEIVADMEALDNGVGFPMDWITPRLEGVFGGNYGEIRATYLNYKMTATIAEVASHQDPADAAVMRDPRGRSGAARACYQAIVKFLNAEGAAPLSLLPDTPVRVMARNSAPGQVTVSWQPAPVDGVGGHAPAGFVVYRSGDGYGFAEPIEVSGGSATSTIVTGLTPGSVVFFQVAAVNAGGESLPSETLGVRVTAGGTPPVLVVNGFDRNDRGLSPMTTIPTNVVSTSGGGATVPLLRPLRMNAFDYVIQHGWALAAAGRDFDAVSNEAVLAGDVVLGGYNAVVWICGREADETRTFDATERTLVTTYLNGGGRLFATGSEIALELDFLGAGVSFCRNTLGVSYVGNSAGTYTAQGAAGGALSSVGTLLFSEASGAPYDANSADRIAPFGTAQAALTYVGGSGGTAGVQYDAGTYRTLVFGFPFETIGSSTIRASVMTAAMDYLLGGPLAVADWTVY